MPQPSQNSLHGYEHGSLRKFELEVQKVVGMEHLDVIISRYFGGEILKVHSDYGIGARVDGSRSHMTIVWVGKSECNFQRLVSLDDAVHHSCIHQVAGALDLLWCQIDAVGRFRIHSS